MPWKGEKDPYKIWISEIILQQTRVQQGLAYYERFIKSFPTIKKLANASEDNILKHWQGLGYYSRCRNLIYTARYIQQQLSGKFPEKYDQILALKGIGTYTAAAIASFAYNQAYAVLDGNVFRVLSRFFGITIPIDSAGGKMMYKSLAYDLLDKNNAGIYNQALMDFGAVVCKPALPDCHLCPLNKYCVALKKQMVKVLPVKQKEISRRIRFFTYLVIEYKKAWYVRKRTTKDIWQGLYEFILLENDSLIQQEDVTHSLKFLEMFKAQHFSIKNTSEIFTQKLTHQTIVGNFLHIKINKPLETVSGYTLVSVKDIISLPFPKFISSYLED